MIPRHFGYYAMRLWILFKPCFSWFLQTSNTAMTGEGANLLATTGKEWNFRFLIQSSWDQRCQCPSAVQEKESWLPTRLPWVFPGWRSRRALLLPHELHEQGVCMALPAKQWWKSSLSLDLFWCHPSGEGKTSLLPSGRWLCGHIIGSLLTGFRKSPLKPGAMKVSISSSAFSDTRWRGARCRKLASVLARDSRLPALFAAHRQGWGYSLFLFHLLAGECL